MTTSPGAVSIAVASSKGGVGKTTATATLAAALANPNTPLTQPSWAEPGANRWGSGASEGKTRRGKVLVVDCDPQANLTSHLLGDDVTVELSLADVLRPSIRRPIRDVIAPTPFTNIDIVPAHPRDLTIAAREIAPERGAENYLDLALEAERVRGDYDYILFDTPPNLGDLTLGAVLAADGVITPVEGDVDSLRGALTIPAFLHSIADRGLGYRHFMGLVIQRYTSGRIINTFIDDTIAGTGINVYESRIPLREAVRHARFQNLPIVLAEPKSDISKAYLSLGREIRRQVLGMERVQHVTPVSHAPTPVVPGVR